MSKFKVGETYKDEGGYDVEIVYHGDGGLLGVRNGSAAHWYELDGTAGFGAFNLVPPKRTVYVNVMTDGTHYTSQLFGTDDEARNSFSVDENGKPYRQPITAHPIEIEE